MKIEITKDRIGYHASVYGPGKNGSISVTMHGERIVKKVGDEKKFMQSVEFWNKDKYVGKVWLMGNKVTYLIAGTKQELEDF